MPKSEVVVIARWTVAPDQESRVVDILARFLPQAQAEPGVKTFQIAHNKENTAEFLFFEVFADEAAFASHQASEHFKTLILGQALPLLADRQRAQYSLL
jgi:quinol monooxygenase YgiN